MKTLVTAAVCSLTFWVNAEAQITPGGPKGETLLENQRLSGHLARLPRFDLNGPKKTEVPGRPTLNFAAPRPLFGQGKLHLKRLEKNTAEVQARNAASMDPGIVIFPNDTLNAHIIQIWPQGNIDPAFS